MRGGIGSDSLQSSAFRRWTLIALAVAAFVSLGLPDGVLGVAWPTVRAHFLLPVSRMGALLAAGVAGSLVSSALAGRLVAHAGVGRVLVGSSCLVAAGLAVYASAPAWWLLPVGGFVIGLGSGAVDAAINTVAAVTFSPRVVTWLHACYGVGATLGPLVMTRAISTSWGWRWGYVWLALVMAVMALVFACARGQWAPAAAKTSVMGEATAVDALRHSIVRLHILCFFLYAGIEVTAGQWLYSLLLESRGFRAVHAGLVVSGYWATLTLGRIAFGQLAAHVGRQRVLRFGLSLAVVASAMLCVRSHSVTTVLGAWLLGFALAPVFPLLMSATPERVGVRFAAHAVGFQVSAATLGIAVVPSLGGFLARGYGLESLPGYLLGLSIALGMLHEGVIRLVLRRRKVESTPASPSASTPPLLVE